MPGMLTEVAVTVDEYLLKRARSARRMNGPRAQEEIIDPVRGFCFNYRRLERPLNITGIDIDPRSRYRPFKVRKALVMTNTRSQLEYEIDGNSPDLVINGILHRLFYEKRELGADIPDCANNIIGISNGKIWVCPTSINKDFRKTFSPFFKPAEILGDVPQLVPLTPEQFVSGYKGPKRRVYEQAVAKLRTMPELEAKHAAVNTFPKYEKVAVKEGRDVRIIQPRSSLYNAAVGPYLLALEPHLYDAFNRAFGHEVVMKGKNAVEVAAVIHRHWTSFDDPVFVGLDASRFDQHIHVAALEFEHAVYMSFFKDHPNLRRLLSYQLRNVGYAKFPTVRIRYEINGTRMSGDMNTSMGNITLMCSMCLTYANMCFPYKYRYINNGDDCGFIIERKHLPLLSNLPRIFDHWGFPMTIEKPVDCIEKIEFCQTRPVFDGEKYIMIRDPTKCITKDQIICQSVTTREHYDQHRKSVSDCGLAVAGNMPVLGSFYAMLGRGANPSRTLKWDQVTGLKWQSLRLKPIRDGRVTDASRISFFRAYGIMPHTQLLLEQRFDAMRPEWSEVQSPIFQQIFVHSV